MYNKDSFLIKYQRRGQIKIIFSPVLLRERRVVALVLLSSAPSASSSSRLVSTMVSLCGVFICWHRNFLQGRVVDETALSSPVFLSLPFRLLTSAISPHVNHRNHLVINTHHCTTQQGKKCNEAALSLLVCMEKTDCVAKQQKSLEECMKDPIESDPCRAERNAYYNCKHSQLNMRTRIRGVRQY